MPHQAKLELHPKTGVLSFEIIEFLNEEQARSFAHSKCVAKIVIDGPRLTIQGVAVPLKVPNAPKP